MNIGYKLKEPDTVRCGKCLSENFSSFIYCIECGTILTPTDERYYSGIAFPFHTCPNCQEMTPNNGKFCKHCKCENIPTKTSHDGKIILGIILLGLVYFI